MRVLVTFVALQATLAFAAGGQETHGGSAVVCRDGDHAITRAFLLDTFEAHDSYHVDIVRSSDDYKKQIDSYVQAMADAQHANGGSGGENIRKALILVQRDWERIEQGKGLALIDDARPILTIKPVSGETCGYEQLASYSSDGFLRVDGEIFDRLDETDKAGIFLHETFFKIERMNRPTVKISTDSRRAVAYVFSGATDSVKLVAFVDAIGSDNSGSKNLLAPNEYLDFLLAGKTGSCRLIGKERNRSGLRAERYDFSFGIQRNETNGIQSVVIGDMLDGALVSFGKDGRLIVHYPQDDDHSITVRIGTDLIDWLPGYPEGPRTQVPNTVLESVSEGVRDTYPLNCGLN